MAKGIAEQQPGIDPAEAFICALLHQLGKLLTIYHLPTEYGEIKTRDTHNQLSEMASVRQALGVSYAMLGSAVAKEWAFPDIICQAMAPISPGQLRRKESALNSLTVLAIKLSKWIA